MDKVTTIKIKLPYKFSTNIFAQRCYITNIRGQTLNVTKAQIIKQLQRDDLDVHRRRMYEAALETLTKAVHHA
jgi:hypothetical protein